MPYQAKKRLLAAQERFRRTYIVWIGEGKTDKGGTTHWPMCIKKRILNHKRIWK